MKQVKLEANSSSKLSLPVNSVKLCLLAQVKPLMEPSLYSLKSPTSSAPERSRCLVAPTRKTWGLSLSWPPTPGPSCSTIKSAPVGSGRVKRRRVSAGQAQPPHLRWAACLWSCSAAMRWLLPWCWGPAPAPPEEWKRPRWCQTAAASSPGSPAAGGQPQISASAKRKKVLAFLFSNKLKYRAKVQESRAKSTGQIHFKCFSLRNIQQKSNN